MIEPIVIHASGEVSRPLTTQEAVELLVEMFDLGVQNARFEVGPSRRPATKDEVSELAQLAANVIAAATEVLLPCEGRRVDWSWDPSPRRPL